MAIPMTFSERGEPTEGMTHAQAAKLMQARGYSQVLTAAGPRDIEGWATDLEWADRYIRFWKTSDPAVIVERKPDGTMTEGLAYGVWTFVRRPDADQTEQVALSARAS